MRVGRPLNPEEPPRHSPRRRLRMPGGGLIRRIGEKDRDALAELYAIYHRRLARFLGRFIRQYEVVQEIVNDTLFIVWQQATGSAAEIARVDVDHGHRVPARASGVAAGCDLGPPCRHSWKIRARAGCARDGRAAGAAGACARYASARTADGAGVDLLSGHSCEEIAAIVECPVNTVKTRMFHARRKLRALLPTLRSGQEQDAVHIVRIQSARTRRRDSCRGSLPARFPRTSRARAGAYGSMRALRGGLAARKTGARAGARQSRRRAGAAARPAESDVSHRRGGAGAAGGSQRSCSVTRRNPSP